MKDNEIFKYYIFIILNNLLILIIFIEYSSNIVNILHPSHYFILKRNTAT